METEKVWDRERSRFFGPDLQRAVYRKLLLLAPVGSCDVLLMVISGRPIAAKFLEPARRPRLETG